VRSALVTNKEILDFVALSRLSYIYRLLIYTLIQTTLYIYFFMQIRKLTLLQYASIPTVRNHCNNGQTAHRCCPVATVVTDTLTSRTIATVGHMTYTRLLLALTLAMGTVTSRTIATVGHVAHV
jgi:hypothetical protein